MTDSVNHLTKSRRPARQYDEGVYGWEQQQRQRSSVLRAGNTRGAPRLARTSSDDIIADYAEPITRVSRTMQNTVNRRSQSTNGGTSMRVTTGDVLSVKRNTAQSQQTQAKTLRQKTYMPQSEQQQQRY